MKKLIKFILIIVAFLLSSYFIGNYLYSIAFQDTTIKVVCYLYAGIISFIIFSIIYIIYFIITTNDLWSEYCFKTKYPYHYYDTDTKEINNDNELDDIY